MTIPINTAVIGLPFGIYADDGTPITAGTTTGFLTIDGSAQGNLTNLGVHKGNGQWTIDLLAAETNGKVIGLVFTNTTSGAVNANVVFSTTDVLETNLVQINGDTVATTNFENTFNGVGYEAATAPAQQQQVQNLSSGSGGNKVVASTVTLTTGTTIDPLSNTFYADGLFYEIAPVGGNIDAYFEYDVSATGSATGAILTLFVQGNNDTCTVQVWNWVNLEWNTVGVVAGTSGQTLQSLTPDIVNGQTGTGVDEGKVRIRFLSANANLIGIEQILCEYNIKADTGFVIRENFCQGGTLQTVVLDAAASSNDGEYEHDAILFTSGTGAGQGGIVVDYNGTTKTCIVKTTLNVAPDSTTKYKLLFAQTHTATTSGGYDGGKIYVDGVSGTAGTLHEVNGTIENPSNNLPDARIIADVENSKTLVFSGGANLALDQAYLDFKFELTQGALFDLNGQDIGGSVFLKSGITGDGVASKRVNFELCGLFNCSLGVASLLNSGISGTITLSNTGRYQMYECFANDSNITPTIDINGDGITQTLLLLNGYKGNLTLSNLTAIDVVVVNGDGIIELDNTCSGGIVEYAGDIRIIDNSTVSPSLTCGVICETYQNLALLDTKVDDLPTVAEFTARTLPTASYSIFNSATDTVTIDADALFTTQMTESYSADGVAPTLAQAMFLTMQNLQDFSYSGVTQAVKGLDGVTTVATYTLDDAITPTSKTRAT